MPVQKSWDEYEVALLIEAYFEIKRDNTKKVTILSSLSKQLRKRAVNLGLEIDDTFRNVNGMVWQERYIAQAFNSSRYESRTPSALFQKMVDLWKNDNAEFNKILIEAHKQVEAKKVGFEDMGNTKDKFCDWLYNQEKLKYSQERILLIIEEASQYVQSHGISKVPLFEITDEKTFSNVCIKLLSQRLFRLMHKQLARDLDICYVYYKAFLIEEAKSITVSTDSPAEESTQSQIPETKKTLIDGISISDKLYVFLKNTSDNNPYGTTLTYLANQVGISENTAKNILSQAEWAILEYGRYRFNYSANKGQQRYNFDNPQSLAFTRPISASYFGENISNADSWRQLYIDVMSILYDDYPHHFENIVGKTVTTAVLPLVVDEADVQKFRVPKSFADGLYVETNRSAKDIMSNLKHILDICCVDYENLCVLFRRKEDSSEIENKTESKSIENNNANRAFVSNNNISIKKSDAPEMTVESKPGSSTENTTDDKICALLKASFPYGIRISSVRDLMRFRLAAEEATVELPESDEKLKKLLMASGTMMDDKIFAKSENMEGELKEKIEAIFASGVNIIYYESLFYAEQEWMEQNHITSDEILKDILKKKIPEYIYTRIFFAKSEKKTEYEALSEEIKRIWGENAVAEITQLSKELPYVPQENIQRVLFATNHFVWVSEGNYLLVDRVTISEQEEEAILEYVEKSCDETGYASLTDIPLGCIQDNNSFVSGNPLYTAIYNKVLSDKYRNNGKILTIGDTTINIVSLLSREFCDREEITFDEVNNRVTELNGGSKRQDSFEILYNNFVRISEEDFLAPKKLHFDVGEIDRVLSDIYQDGFGAIKDVTTFAMFPVCGTTWNHYVLESYCYRYSQKYYLSILNFNSKNAGIIGEKKSGYSYDQMLAMALAEASVDLNETDAGEYLFQRGMMAKRKYAKLGEIISEAERIRKEK